MTMEAGTLKEFLRHEVQEISSETEMAYKEIKPHVDRTVDELRKVWDDIFDELQKEDYYTSYEERLKQTPKEKGTWVGERGESKFIPDLKLHENAALIEKMKEYGIDAIEYKNAEPDFSKCSKATVEIDDMTKNRYDYFDDSGNRRDGNFTLADKKLAEQFNAEAKDEKTDWKVNDIEKYRYDNKLSWHERCDTKTMDLVPREIHEFYGHSGGCAECKVRDSVGGGFDE